MINMPNPIYLPDKIVEEVEDTATPQKTHHYWFWEELDPLDITTRNVPPSFEKEEGTQIVLTEIQSQEEQLTGHYYSWNEVPSGEIFGVSGGALVIGAAIGSSAIFNGGLTIKGQMPATRFSVWPVTWEPRSFTQDSEQLTWDKCRQVLSAFASHAKEVLEHKKIEITGTRIRNWQAIDDTNWKQCILDITVKAESHVALSIWDELSEELRKFINNQPAIDHPFLRNNLSLNVEWGQSGQI